jgi:hypothetical protein
MDQITKENFKLVLERAGFTVSRCGTCGLPVHKCYLKDVHDSMIEVRPTHTTNGSFVIKKGGSAVASGYLYDLSKHLAKHFPTAQV